MGLHFVVMNWYKLPSRFPKNQHVPTLTSNLSQWNIHFFLSLSFSRYPSLSSFLLLLLLLVKRRYWRTAYGLGFRFGCPFSFAPKMGGIKDYEEEKTCFHKRPWRSAVLVSFFLCPSNSRLILHGTNILLFHLSFLRWNIGQFKLKFKSFINMNSFTYFFPPVYLEIWCDILGYFWWGIWFIWCGNWMWNFFGIFGEEFGSFHIEIWCETCRHFPGWIYIVVHS